MNKSLTTGVQGQVESKSHFETLLSACLHKKMGTSDEDVKEKERHAHGLHNGKQWWFSLLIEIQSDVGPYINVKWSTWPTFLRFLVSFAPKDSRNDEKECTFGRG